MTLALSGLAALPQRVGESPLALAAADGLEPVRGVVWVSAALAALVAVLRTWDRRRGRAVPTDVDR